MHSKATRVCISNTEAHPQTRKNVKSKERHKVSFSAYIFFLPEDLKR